MYLRLQDRLATGLATANNRSGPVQSSCVPNMSTLGPVAVPVQGL